jgi:hypothetical protein
MYEYIPIYFKKSSSSLIFSKIFLEGKATYFRQGMAPK